MVMNEKQLLEGLEEICLKEENIKKILQAKTKDDVKELFAQKGIEITDERFKILKDCYSKVVEEMKKLSQEELDKVSGGGDISDRVKLYGTMGVGGGSVWGLGVGAVLGGIYAIVDTSSKSKDGDGFLKNVWKVIGKTSAATLSTAVLGAAIGGIGGMGVGAWDGGVEKCQNQYWPKPEIEKASAGTLTDESGLCDTGV